MTAAEQLHGAACGCVWCRAESAVAHDEGCECPECDPAQVSAADVEAGEERARRSYERAHGPEAW